MNSIQSIVQLFRIRVDSVLNIFRY